MSFSTVFSKIQYIAIDKFSLSMTGLDNKTPLPERVGHPQKRPQSYTLAIIFMCP